MAAPVFRASLSWVLALSAAGCFLVAPLGEYEDAPGSAPGASRGGGNGGIAGSRMESSSGEGGAAGAEPMGGAPPAAGTSGDAGEPPVGPSGCASNEECVELAHGDPSHCTDAGKCVALENGVCPLVYDDEGFKAADPIYVGAFAPLSATVPENSVVLYPLRMALREISGDAFGGILMPNGKRRPIVLVACDNGEDSVDAAAKHLFDDIGVSAVLATLLPGDLRRVFERYEDRNVFFLSPVGATSAVAALDDRDLVWTMLGQPKDLVPVYRDLVEDLVEPYLRNVRGIGDRPLKVALLRGADAFGVELSSLVAAELTWNGKSIAENTKDENYRGFTFDGTLDPADVATELLEEFVPDLVISTAGEEVTRADSGLIDQLETQWGRLGLDVPRPFYVLSPFNAGDLNPLIDLLGAELVGTDHDATKRFIAVTAASAEDDSLQQQFAVDLRDAFSASNPDTGNYYDALYFLTYALYGARVDDPQGTDIARGMHRLLDGMRFNVGVEHISAVFDALAMDGTSIELDGTLGPPAFDPASGVHVDPGAVLCFGTSPGTNNVYVAHNALRYERASGSFQGKFSCFNDFF